MLPPTIRRFIRQHLTSIEQLEVLQLIANNPDTQWTAPAVYKTVLTNVTSICQCLDHFTAAGLFRRTGSDPAEYRWNAGSETSATVADLCRLYIEMPVRVIGEIYQTGSPAQEFADAFKIKHQA